MRRFLSNLAAAFFLIIAILFCFGAPLHAQRRNTFYVEQFPGATVGQKTLNAQAACNPAFPCVLVFDPTLGVWASGVMPSQGVNEIWQDYRTPGGVFASSQGYVSTFGASGSYLAAAAGSPRFWAKLYDSTPTYNASAKLPFGLPAPVGSGVRVDYFASNANQDRVFAITGSAQCGTPDADLPTLGAENAKLGGYFFGGGTADSTGCAPMGANLVVAGYYPQNTSIVGTEIDVNVSGSNPPSGDTTTAGINIASGGPNKVGTGIVFSATSYPTNGFLTGITLTNWLEHGVLCDPGTGGTGADCYFAGPLKPLATSLGTQKRSSDLRFANSRWNGSAQVQDILNLNTSPDATGVFSCFQFMDSSDSTSYLKACNRFSGTAAIFGGSTTLAAQLLGASVVTSYGTSVPGLRLTPSTDTAGVAFAVSNAANSQNQMIINSDGSIVVGTNAVTVSPSTGVTIPSIKSNTGTRYVCVNTSGQLVSQTTACSGT